MKIKIFILSLLLSLVLLTNINFSYVNAYANELEQIEELIIDDESISNNSIIVILNEEDTYSFKEYDESDFDEYDCISVEELTAYSSEVLKQQLTCSDNSESIIDLNSFRRILKLTLEETTKSNILSKEGVKSPSFYYKKLMISYCYVLATYTP